MEVYFVDIGRGTSSLILLGQRRAIIIDCGRTSGVLLQLLTGFQIEEIAVLVVSHNHEDHVGGALAVLTAYEGRIEKLCYLEDGGLRKTKLWQKILQQLLTEIISPAQLVRLECENTPRMLYQEKSRRLSLKIFSPNFVDNLQAVGERNPNATSGVLVLTLEGKRIVFAGDSTIRQWRRIREARGKPIDCDILSVAHHAGIVCNNPEELQWLYAEGVQPRNAIVSVATSNTDGHPRPEVIKTLISSGATVVCTQITTRCCESLEPIRPGVLAPQLPGRSKSTPDRTAAGNSRNVACGGTIVAEFAKAQFSLRRVADHQAAVDRLLSSAGGHPLCR